MTALVSWSSSDGVLSLRRGGRPIAERCSAALERRPLVRFHLATTRKPRGRFVRVVGPRPTEYPLRVSRAGLIGGDVLG